MTDKLFNKELLIKYFQEQTLDSENEKILHWLQADEDNVKTFNELKLTWELFDNKSKITDNGSDWESLKNKMIVDFPKKKQKIKLAHIVIRYAAAILLGFILFFSADQFIFTKNDIYSNANYNEVIVPKGEKSQVHLSDGTKVWLNSGSKLRYPNSFNKEERSVYLEGEAFFDVVKKQKQKFIVHTYSEKINVKVLGTKFNIKSYPEDDIIETTLISGSVIIENENEEEMALLKPNQTAVFSKKEGGMSVQETSKNIANDKLLTKPIKKKAIRISEVNTDNIISWKDELLIFNNESLDIMAVKLERWFGVEIIIENNELKNYKYRGKFEGNTTIYEVLEVIKLTTPIRYTVSKSKIKIDLDTTNNEEMGK